IVMDFKHPDGRTVAVLLPQRSLLVMSGESRYLWTHGITPRKFDVVQASEGELFPSVCDSQHKERAPLFHNSDKDASVLEQKYVHEVYEDIARHFSNTRHSPWPQVVEFLKGLP
ncbi:hypothetical protein E2320_005470, partial [Naja naja]